MAAKSGRILQKVSPRAEHAYGTDEEVHNRDQVSHQPAASNFRQVGPEDNEGMNLANPTASSRSGPFKFSAGV